MNGQAMNKPLLVRLPNWIGDVVMALPSLRLLESHGYALQLIGKGWAPSLLSGEHWPVQVYPRTHRARVQLLKTLATEARQKDPHFDRRLNALTFPNSFSSAWELRLAGLRTCGYRHDMRRWLLASSFALPSDVHQLLSYWQLVTRLLAVDTSPPVSLDLHVAPAADDRVGELIRTHQLTHGYVVLCPFAQGQLQGRSKKWPPFGELAACLTVMGLSLVVCPGPNEEREARESFATATILSGVNLADYAALLKHATLVIANDTGPGHMAAGVGARLLSVLGPTDPKRYGPWGSTVTMLNNASDWPTIEQVLEAVRRVLATAS